MDGAVLVPNPNGPGLWWVVGDGSVIFVEARWGRLPFVVESGKFANLSLQLPATSNQGSTEELGSLAAEYLDGGQTLSFESISLTGRVTVVSMSAEQVDVAIDGAAVHPTTDYEHRVSVPLVGHVTLARTQGTKCSTR